MRIRVEHYCIGDAASMVRKGDQVVRAVCDTTNIFSGGGPALRRPCLWNERILWSVPIRRNDVLRRFRALPIRRSGIPKTVKHGFFDAFESRFTRIGRYGGTLGDECDTHEKK